MPFKMHERLHHNISIHYVIANWSVDLTNQRQKLVAVIALHKTNKEGFHVGLNVNVKGLQWKYWGFFQYEKVNIVDIVHDGDLH
jgi:hypothetical protein